jgi:murein DD-endopeptidase MepM/ murein hydrolase activator NlpD
MHQFKLNKLETAKNSILTQNKILSLRKIKLRWFFITLFLPFFGVVIALSPTQTDGRHYLQSKTIVEEITLPIVIDLTTSKQEFWQIAQVKSGDTLGSLFKRLNIHDDEVVKFLMLNPDASALNTQLVPGHSIEVKTNSDGKLLHLEYIIDAENILVANFTSNGFEVTTQKLLLQNHQVLKSATITDSLFGATDKADIPDQIALQIIDILSGEIDFQDDLHSGDQFNVIYEAFYNAGEIMKTGKVLAVEFINNHKKYQAIHFGEADGKFAYYTPQGQSLHKSFLRSPLEFTRISSGFNAKRFHPILHRLRAHQGVDFAAPLGTRIKASGDGIIDFVGRKGGYGNVIVIKHKSGISTVYGHLSRVAEGVRKGVKIEQGEIIGFVGMSGLATGPHLHYEFLVGKEHRDPMTVKLPTSIPIDAKYKKAFDVHSTNVMAQLEVLNHNQVATRE